MEDSEDRSIRNIGVPRRKSKSLRSTTKTPKQTKGRIDDLLEKEDG